MQLLGWKQPGFLLSHSIPGSISDLHQHPIAASPSKRCVSKIKLFFFWEKKKDFNTSDYFWTTWHYIQKSDDRWELLLIKAQNPSHPPPPLTKTKKSFQKAILISENKVLPFFLFFFLNSENVTINTVLFSVLYYLQMSLDRHDEWHWNIQLPRKRFTQSVLRNVLKLRLYLYEAKNGASLVPVKIANNSYISSFTSFLY